MTFNINYSRRAPGAAVSFSCAHRPLQLKNPVHQGFVAPVFLIAAGILEPRELSGKGSPIRPSHARHAPARAAGSTVRRTEDPGRLDEGLGSQAGARQRARRLRRCGVGAAAPALSAWEPLGGTEPGTWVRTEEGPRDRWPSMSLERGRTEHTQLAQHGCRLEAGECVLEHTAARLSPEGQLTPTRGAPGQHRGAQPP